MIKVTSLTIDTKEQIETELIDKRVKDLQIEEDSIINIESHPIPATPYLVLTKIYYRGI